MNMQEMLAKKMAASEEGSSATGESPAEGVAAAALTAEGSSAENAPSSEETPTGEGTGAEGEEDEAGSREAEIAANAAKLAETLSAADSYEPPAGSYKAGLVKQIMLGRGRILKANKHGYFEPTKADERKMLAVLHKRNDLNCTPV